MYVYIQFQYKFILLRIILSNLLKSSFVRTFLYLNSNQQYPIPSLQVQVVERKKIVKDWESYLKINSYKIIKIGNFKYEKNLKQIFQNPTRIHEKREETMIATQIVQQETQEKSKNQRKKNFQNTGVQLCLSFTKIEYIPTQNIFSQKSVFVSISYRN